MASGYLRIGPDNTKIIQDNGNYFNELKTPSIPFNHDNDYIVTCPKTILLDAGTYKQVDGTEFTFNAPVWPYVEGGSKDINLLIPGFESTYFQLTVTSKKTIALVIYEGE